ncbi:MAG: adenylosuccinate synthetase [Opitutales bacterium]|nr:adenylosuccinate synthetase [Opitutales bacterium]
MSLEPFQSKIIADVGISMGDEGKGRLISEVVNELCLSTGRDNPVGIVMKVNGGSNSGHTAGGLKLNLLPAGVVEKNVDSLAVGAGVVADPRKFLWEMQPLEKRGYDIKRRLLIDEKTMVSDPTHRLLDLAWEEYRSETLGESPRGSTGRGITPSYQDEVGQWQIWYGDFQGPRDLFARKMEQRIDRALRTIQHVCRVSPENWSSFFQRLTEAEQRANQAAVEEGIFPLAEFDFHQFAGSEPFTLNQEALIETYWQAGQALIENIGDLREEVLRTLREERYIIGEFGQSFWLDKRHGFPPNVTASHTYTPEFFQSAGVPNQAIHTFGVAKAYDTKVGTHIFLTEMEESCPLTAILKKIEFGTSTGRQRMVGWFDAVEKGDALRYGGFQDLMINKLDALSQQGDWQGPLKICVAYEDEEGRRYHHVPRRDSLRGKLRPIYREFPCWQEDISTVRNFADLPLEAKDYFAGMIRAIVECAYHDEPWPPKLPNVRYLGVGPDPSQIIKDLPPVTEILADHSTPA